MVAAQVLIFVRFSLKEQQEVQESSTQEKLGGRSVAVLHYATASNQQSSQSCEATELWTYTCIANLRSLNGLRWVVRNTWSKQL